MPQSFAGKLSVIGLGPGDRGLMTPRAVAALQQAELVIGYRGYLDPIGDLLAGKEVQARELGEEHERASSAIAAARSGRRVALVSSGDPGIYGMASLVVELLGDDDSIELDIIPGITAASAAASLLGAPLGHDFAAISLSDLLTPWDEIESRLHAAGRGDFVVALYNPASSRRAWQLDRARQILLNYRPANTPVGLIEQAYRPGERRVVTALGAIDASCVTMFSIVIIGNRQTRVMGGRLVTPRGYVQSGSSGRSQGSEPFSTEDLPVAASDPGDAILAESFRMVEAELAGHAFSRDEFEIVRRMVHATADFDFASAVRFHPQAIAAGIAALQAGTTIVTDVEMLRSGIRRDLLHRVRATAACLLNDQAATALARAATITRSAAGMRVAAERFKEPIIAIGSAPTALAEVLDLARAGDWKPRLVIGIPVGFVGVVEAKRQLAEQHAIPFITCLSRKGGTAVTAAVVNALLELAG